jgi:hypothetical protein
MVAKLAALMVCKSVCLMAVYLVVPTAVHLDEKMAVLVVGKWVALRVGWKDVFLAEKKVALRVGR